MIEITKDAKADSRSAIGEITKKELKEATENHRDDVGKILEWMGGQLWERGMDHDWTKLKYLNKFYKEFVKSRKGELNFTDGEWYKIHIKKERHHLNARVPDDVDLFDLLERIADVVAAGLSRSGTVFLETISADVVLKAYHNTLEKVKANVVVLDR